jgi:hypothetical protein
MHGTPREIKLLFHFQCKAAQSGANPVTEGFTETFSEGFSVNAHWPLPPKGNREAAYG